MRNKNLYADKVPRIFQAVDLLYSYELTSSLMDLNVSCEKRCFAFFHKADFQLDFWCWFIFRPKFPPFKHVTAKTFQGNFRKQKAGSSISQYSSKSTISWLPDVFFMSKTINIGLIVKFLLVFVQQSLVTLKFN